MNQKVRLNCPMPQLDFDTITLGHGSGGVLTHKLLESGVFELLGNEILDTRHDGALLKLEGEIAMTTDSFVVSPITFPGGDIGDLAVNGTVNDIAMCGAIPEYISLAFILEEGLKMETFWEVLVSVKDAAKKAGVTVVTGDTKVVDRGKGDQIFINTTGIGHVHPKASISLDRIKTGDKILVSGPIAQHGVAILSVREGLTFETEIESDTRSLNKEVCALLDSVGDDVHLLRDPTRGGVATVLAEISKTRKLGVALQQNELPVSSEVEAACEIFGLDPLYVANEGIFLAVIDAKSAEKGLEILQKQPYGSMASIIGEVVEDHKGQVILHSAIGGRRVVNMLPGEQLPRIC